MTLNRNRKALNDKTSLRTALLYMQSLSVDIGIYHECGGVEREDTIARLENDAREEGCDAIVAGTPGSTAAGTVILVRGVWRKCIYRASTKIYTELGAGGSRLIRMVFRGTGPEPAVVGDKYNGWRSFPCTGTMGRNVATRQQ